MSDLKRNEGERELKEISVVEEGEESIVTSDVCPSVLRHAQIRKSGGPRGRLTEFGNFMSVGPFDFPKR